LQQRTIVGGLGKRGMEGCIRYARHSLLFQFFFLLLKDGFQAEQILTVRAFRCQSRDRRFDEQSEFENILKGEMMQGLSKIFRFSAGDEVSRTLAAHNQTSELHHSKSFAKRRPAHMHTFGESALGRQAVAWFQPALIQQAREANYHLFVDRSPFGFRQCSPPI